MTQKGREKRRYERIFFTREQCIAGVFAGVFGEFENPEARFEAVVLNLSEGGLHFTRKRDGGKAIQPGDRLRLQSLQGPAPLNYAQGVEVEIKWVLDHEYLEHVGYGCEFVDPPPALRHMIQEVVRAGVLGSKD